MRVLRLSRDLAAGALLVALAACSGGSSDVTLEPLTTTTTEPPTTESPGTTSTTEPDLPEVTGPWVPATGNLAGLPSECGNLPYVSVRPDRDMVIASVALQGLWASENGSDTWAKLGQGPGSDEIINRGTAIVYDPAKPDTFWESGIYNGGGVYRTDDNGRTFRQLGNVAHAESISVDLTDPDRQTLLTGTHDETRVNRSTDGGATWTDISATLPADIGVTSTPVAQTASTYLLGTNNGANSGIFRTTDAGATWTQVFKGGVMGLPLEAKADDSIYWVLAQAGGVVKSTDGGATWSQVAPDGTVNPSAPSIVELPDGRLAAAGRTVVISSDGGKSWRAVGPGMPITPAGLSYSPSRKAFYIWYFSCAIGAPNPVMPDAIMRLDFDHATQ